MMRRILRSSGAILSLLAAASLMSQPASALGGAAASKDSGLASHIVMVLSSRTNTQGVCTGTVIARDVVLTAAHCVINAQHLAVAYFENGSPVLQRVIAHAVNPGFSKASRVSIDMALVRVESSFPSRLTPLPFDRGNGTHEVGLNRTIAGFGLSVDRDEKSAGTLRSAHVTVLPRLYPRFLRLGLDSDTTLANLAICRGDSGGPVLEQSLGSTLLVGVVYGVEKFPNARTCGTTAQAVRVAPQRAWIEAVMSRWAQGLPGSPPATPRPQKAKRVVAQTGQ